LRTVFLVCALGIGLLRPAHGAPLDPCIAPSERITGHVVRVEVNGALILDDGRAAVLEGIRLPKGGADRAPQFLAAQALNALSGLAVNRVVTLALRDPKEDRYGRLRAQVYVDDTWVQLALLREGFARAAPAPARGECARTFDAAENSARTARLGLWAAGAYALRTPDTISNADLGTFQIVEGRVENASVKGGRAYLNFGTDWKTDFTVTIAPDDMARFRAANIDPRDYAGKTVRVRGFVDRLNGPEIEIGTPAAIAILPDARDVRR